MELEAIEILTSKPVLTCREVEFLTAAALGYTNKNISVIFTVEKCTVKKTFESVFKKLDANNRAHAITLAFVLHKIIPEEYITAMNNSKEIQSFKKIYKRKRRKDRQ